MLPLMMVFGLALAVAASGSGPLLVQPSRTCGKDVFYSTDEYVCRQGFLCPIVNGEPLSLCGRSCYSQYMYTCRSGTDLQMRPLLDRGNIVLRAENQQDRGGYEHGGGGGYGDGGYGDGGSRSRRLNVSASASVDGKLMTACHFSWNLAGTTCSYCPMPPLDPHQCPPGNLTALSAATNVMNVLVPGGQRFFLRPDWTVGYTQAHSALLPNGSSTAGFKAFDRGGYFNVLDGAWGWAACGPAHQKTLHVRNSTNADELSGCIGLNLKIESFDDGQVGAWQYS